MITHYEILHLLGRHAWGGEAIYRARHRGTGQLVRLDVQSNRHQGPAARAHQLARYEAIALLCHPNILPILEAGEGDGCVYIVQPDMADGDLHDHLRQGRPAARQATALTESLARAVHHAHEHGIFHCDIKPGSVLMTAAGVPLLTNFECARVRFIRTPQPEQILEGAIVGTPAFMAPEQAMGRCADWSPAIDVWGLGALLYTLLAGQPPFARASPIETIMAMVNEEVPRLSDIEPGIERDLEIICGKCLEKKPENRYVDALTLAEDLERYQRGEPIGRPPGASLKQRLGGWVRRWIGG